MRWEATESLEAMDDLPFNEFRELHEEESDFVEGANPKAKTPLGDYYKDLACCTLGFRGDRMLLDLGNT
jgi:hypothetical protein